MDPREDKLPKWAQELIYEERMKTALRFPDEPRPEPDFRIDGSGHGVGTPSLNSAAGSWVYSQNSSGIFKHYVGKGGYLFKTDACEGFGSRGGGGYFLDLRDARLARRWDIASKAASSLLIAMTEQPRN